MPSRPHERRCRGCSGKLLPTPTELVKVSIRRCGDAISVEETLGGTQYKIRYILRWGWLQSNMGQTWTVRVAALIITGFGLRCCSVLDVWGKLTFTESWDFT